MEQLTLTPQASTRLYPDPALHNAIVDELMQMASRSDVLMTRHELAAHFSEQFGLPITIWHVDNDVKRASEKMGRKIELRRKPRANKQAQKAPDAMAAEDREREAALQARIQQLENELAHEKELNDKATKSAARQAQVLKHMRTAVESVRKLIDLLDPVPAPPPETAPHA